MAVCTGHGGPAKGRLFFAYVHHYTGDERQERRVRLCQDCVAELLAPLLEQADYREGDEWHTNLSQAVPQPLRSVG